MGELTLTDQKDNLFGEVPIIHFKNNYELTGNFEGVISLIDAYDDMQSDSMNDFDYFTDAYLMLKGMDGTEDDDVKKMKNNRVILVDEKFSGNLSGIAIKFKLFCLEQLAVMKERKFKKAFQRRNELITNMLKLKGANYDYTEIDMTFVRNITANLVDIATMINDLRGVVSNQTLIAQLPFITDVKDELDKVKQEQEENSSINLDTVPSRTDGGDNSVQQPVLDEQNGADSSQHLQQTRSENSKVATGV